MNRLFTSTSPLAAVDQYYRINAINQEMDIMTNQTWIVCIDGTWNNPGQTDEDPVTKEEGVTPSNVVKTWEFFTGQVLPARDTCSYDDNAYGTVATLASGFGPGAAIYLNGVGGESNSRFLQVWDGATGTGTSERIRDAYRFLTSYWRPGDRIMAFGFSRGAFAVRSLAGFINCVGMPLGTRMLKEETLLALYDCYRNGRAPSTGAVSPVHWVKTVPIDFLGLWDTVGSLAMARTVNAFHQISPANVRYVAHALALDEQRKQFVQSNWQCSPNQHVNEVWFRGVHTNIGGGYEGDDLSNITRIWMMSQVNRAGLACVPLPTLPGYNDCNVLEGERDSLSEFLQKFKTIGRFIQMSGLEATKRRIQQSQTLHPSVFEAMNAIPSVGQNPYRPIAQLPDGSKIAPDKIDLTQWSTPSNQL
ncbi:DUF2235 domain-containing protein [Chitinivorax sp. B]|uniref:phospholipase effector Tle1 domain-containing protein n=1 Tax=Chitinivorax sp. B TaxID=2502235 RepID=UPI00148535AD|nr:DUF2235 domain-containing protein [Chitinivorax sp. B]